MKHILLEVKELPGEVAAGEERPKFKYREQLINIARAGGTQGITIEEVRKRMRLLDVLEPLKDHDIAAFEDSDHEVLARLVKATPWGMASKVVIDFVDAVTVGSDSLGELGRSNGHVESEAKVEV